MQVTREIISAPTSSVFALLVNPLPNVTCVHCLMFLMRLLLLRSLVNMLHQLGIEKIPETDVSLVAERNEESKTKIHTYIVISSVKSER